MAIEIKSPTFPESVADGTVANWVKKEGDQVNQDEIIAEIETDKVVLEVVAPSDGVLTKILKKEGDIVNSAEVIGEFDDTQEASWVSSNSPITSALLTISPSFFKIFVKTPSDGATTSKTTLSVSISAIISS